MQAINSCVQRFTFNRNRVGELNRGVLIGAGSPDLSVRNNLPPDGAALHQRPVIVHGDVGDTDALCDGSPLAVAGNVQLGGLSKGVGRRQQARTPSTTGRRRLYTGFLLRAVLMKWKFATSESRINPEFLDCSSHDNVSTARRKTGHVARREGRSETTENMTTSGIVDCLCARDRLTNCFGKASNCRRMFRIAELSTTAPRI